MCLPCPGAGMENVMRRLSRNDFKRRPPSYLVTAGVKRCYNPCGAVLFSRIYELTTQFKEFIYSHMTKKIFLIGCRKSVGEINGCRLLFRFHLSSRSVEVTLLFFSLLLDEQNQKLNMKCINRSSFYRSTVWWHLKLITEYVYPKSESQGLSLHRYPLWGTTGGDQAFPLIPTEFESWDFFLFFWWHMVL